MNFSEFSENDLTVDAVARNFSLLGEAAGRLDKEKLKINFQKYNGEISQDSVTK